jgi:hypothetical protein
MKSKTATYAGFISPDLFPRRTSMPDCGRADGPACASAAESVSPRSATASALYLV